MTKAPCSAVRVLIRHALALVLLSKLFGFSEQDVLLAQGIDLKINRLTHCIPSKPPRGSQEEQTLCQQYSELPANKVIGINQFSVSYSSTEKDPPGSGGWYDQVLFINGTLLIDDTTRFINCIVKMGPGARIIVEQGKMIFSRSSVFFACDRMWEGIRLEPNSFGVFVYCVFEDANNAIHTTINTPNYLS